MSSKRATIAKNIALMLHDGDVVNLGVGLPTMVSNYLPAGMTILLHGENGCIGQDRELPYACDFNDRDSVTAYLCAHDDAHGGWRTGHRDLCNASDAFITLVPGACCFDSAMSFAIARGGHLDATVLGGLQVDAEGSLANWAIPGKRTNGMGGAMDLVSGAKKVIVAMEHCAKDGAPKLVASCTMPLTGVHCVSVLVTELCIVEFIDRRPVVRAMAAGLTREELQAVTGAALVFPDTIETMAEA